MKQQQEIASSPALDDHTFNRLVTRYGEDLLIAAYAFTGNADQAEQLVLRVLHTFRQKGPLADYQPSVYVYLYDQVCTAANRGQIQSAGTANP